MRIIESARLRLLALSRSQLALCLNDLPALERELGLPIAREVIDENVVRALTLKLKKMDGVYVSRHEWFTYWLIVIKEENIGAGFLGFKGYPDEQGSTEIGYSITCEKLSRPRRFCTALCFVISPLGCGINTALRYCVCLPEQRVHERSSPRAD